MTRSSGVSLLCAFVFVAQITRAVDESTDSSIAVSSLSRSLANLSDSFSSNLFARATYRFPSWVSKLV